LTEFDPASIAASYDVVAESYADKLFHELEYKPFDRELLDEVARRAHGVICDLGCGPGHVARYLAEHGADVIGVDLSAEMVALARRLNPGLRFEQGNMLDLDGVEDGAWAAVVALYSLIHIERSRVPEALSEMHRVLQRGGILVVGVHGGEGEIRHDEFLGHPVPFTGTFFELDELRAFVESAGFAIERAVERAPYAEEGATQRVYVVATVL
jgi:SAM-dependent methyltransferase